MKYYVVQNDEGEIIQITHSFAYAEEEILKCFSEDEEVEKVFARDSNNEIVVSYKEKGFDFFYYTITQCHFEEALIRGYYGAKKTDEEDFLRLTRKEYNNESTLQFKLYCMGWNNYLDEINLEKEAEKYMRGHKNG